MSKNAVILAARVKHDMQRMSKNAVILVILALACARAERRTPTDTIVFAVDNDITEADPRYAQTNADAKVSRLIAPGLVAVDQVSLEPRLELAQAVDRIDPVTWEVTLRAGLRFSDGALVAAGDVVYTFRSVLDPGMKSVYRKGFAERIRDVEALDDRRVRFRLKEPLATFLTDLDFGIVSKRAHEAERGGRFGNGGCVGAGPYRLVSLMRGETMLVRNENYHGPPPPIRRLVFRTIRLANARLLALAGGSVDITQNTVRADLIKDVREAPGLRVQTGPSALLSYLMFQNEDAILKDARVRRAIAHAIDREKIVRSKFGGLAVLATGLLAPSHWAYSSRVDDFAYNPDLARRLLDEAGFPDADGPGGRPRFRLTYKTSADPFRVSVARTIAQDLREVGIEVEVRSFEFSTFYADIKKGNFQLASMQTSEIVEPDMYYAYFHSSRIPSKDQPDVTNRWRYRSSVADSLLEAGRHELDREARRGIYAQIQHLLSIDMPIVPLWHEDNIAIMRANVLGYAVLPNGRLASLAGTYKVKLTR